MITMALVGIFSPLRSIRHYGFMTFLSKVKSPSTLNRSIFKQELYHTSQKNTQYDCPVNIFSHKHKYMYKEQSLCKLLSQNVINMSLLKALVLSVVLVYFRWHESVSKCHTCTKKVRRRIKPVFRK